MALISCGVRRRPSSSRRVSVPICRLMEATVPLALVTAWRRARSPTSRSPVFVKATTDGVVRAPSALGMMTGFPPSTTAMQLLVVPRSIPMIALMTHDNSLPISL